MSDELRLCDHHNEQLFRFGSKTLVDGEIQDLAFQFCRSCADSTMTVTCPECEKNMTLIKLDDSKHIYAHGTVRELSCTNCNAVIASANVAGV